MGSKSTNQLCNSAPAIASSVAFIRRFNSILSSSAPSTAAMAFCSARGAKRLASDEHDYGSASGSQSRHPFVQSSERLT